MKWGLAVVSRGPFGPLREARSPCSAAYWAAGAKTRAMRKACSGGAHEGATVSTTTAASRCSGVVVVVVVVVVVELVMRVWLC